MYEIYKSIACKWQIFEWNTWDGCLRTFISHVKAQKVMGQNDKNKTNTFYDQL